MFHFFIPQTKVQKDRAIMRDTDARVAKYSRRGLVLNFIVFVLCLAFGNFEQKEHNTAIVLVTGLLLVTLWRAYFLFRFDALYARAPARWRNQYFLASCIGAAWWSVILVTLTWHLGMENEAMVMWLYSVVFYSSVANVFAPYRHFLIIYLAIGQIPAAITAILLGDAESVLYGCIMLMFFYMLSHQGKVTCNTYWERLEANLALRERAYGLEKERASSQAQMELKNEFLVNLGQEFRSSISDVLTTLSLVDEAQLSEHHRELLTMSTKAAGRQIDLVNNVVDFSKITTKTLILDAVEFDLRRVLEKFVQDYSLDAHQQGVELFYVIDSTIPVRAKGDVARLNQILSTLFNYSLKNPNIEQIFIEAKFNQGQDENGRLEIVISNNIGMVVGSSAVTIDETETHMQGIGLSICKGLTECMGGSLHIREGKNRTHRIFMNVDLQVISHEETRLGAEHKLAGKGVLLVDLPEVNGNALADEMKAWGMNVWITTGQEASVNKLNELMLNKSVDAVLIYTRLINMNGLAISRELVGKKEFADLPQFIAMSNLQSDTPEMRLHLRQYPHIAIIEKPIIRRRLYELVLQKLLFNGSESANQLSRESDSLGNAIMPKVLLVQDHRVEQMVMSAMLKKLGCQVHIVAQGLDAVQILESEHFDILLMDYDMREQESLIATQKIRERERDLLAKHLPIIAVTSSYDDKDQSDCVASGMDDAIAKPIRYEDLEAKLRRWIQND
ncbi:MAG: response regulator [Cellvibrio sp.]|nr:response regulator [Cellvibrio sp.]